MLTGADRRRRWTRAEEARVTAESFAAGETVMALLNLEWVTQREG